MVGRLSVDVLVVHDGARVNILLGAAQVCCDPDRSDHVVTSTLDIY